MLALKSWGNAWIEYRVDPDTGQWTAFRLTEPDATNNSVGFASLEPVWGVYKRFYAFYAHGGRLYLQAGRRKWDITSGLKKCLFWCAGFGFMSGLILKFENGQSHHPVLIHPLRAFQGDIDATYDGMDAEDDHFFLFLRRHLLDAKWRQALINRERAAN